MKNKKATATQTRPQRMGSWHPEGWIAPGSARVLIDGDSFGARFLGQEEFIVFRNVEAATEEAHTVLANHPHITVFEVHEYRSTGEWYTVGAGAQAHGI